MRDCNSKFLEPQTGYPRGEYEAAPQDTLLFFHF